VELIIKRIGPLNGFSIFSTSHKAIMLLKFWHK